MVAAAGETDTIPVRTIVLCLAAIVAGWILTVALGSRDDVLQRMPLEKSPEVLAQKAREVVQSFGYTGRPTDSAFGLGSDGDYQNYAQQRKNPGEFRAQLAKGQPPLIHFWYRQSPRPLETFGPDNIVSELDPPPEISGMAGLQFDTLGRLIYFTAVPPQVEETPVPASAADPKPLFAAAGLDPARFTSTEPKWTPLSISDARAAWTGFYPDAPEVPVRVEAAWWRGKPVYFRTIGPWTRPERVQEFQLTAGQTISNWVFLILGIAVFLTAAFLAWRNFRLGRGDVRGAARLAVFMLCLTLLSRLLLAKHVPKPTEFDFLQSALSAALYMAGLYWGLYIALEPYVRRRWPQSLISWSRLLAGGFRDPLVSGQVLIGLAVGFAYYLLGALSTILSERVGLQTGIGLFRLRNVLDMRHLAGSYVSALQTDVQIPLILFFVFFLLRVLLRRDWMASLVCILLIGGLSAINSPYPLIPVLFSTTIIALVLFILIRFGILPLMAMFYVVALTNGFPITTDLSAWYAGGTVLSTVMILALAAYAFHIARAGRPLFKESFLE
jgi:serine/threonine-protein kinase